MDQELTSMKMDKKEIKKNMGPTATPGEAPKGPQFPWGLQVTLEDSSLKKMDISLADYKVGDMVELYAQCKVTRLSQSQNQSEHGNNEKNRTMELQITDMCLEAVDEGAQEEKDNEDSMSWDDDTSSEKVTKSLKNKGY